MTNILFFSTIYRDDESVSSSSLSETSESPQTVAQASLSAYSVIGKAWLACARPQLEADEDVDNSTANTSAPARKFDVDNSTANTGAPATKFDVDNSTANTSAPARKFDVDNSTSNTSAPARKFHVDNSTANAPAPASKFHVDNSTASAPAPARKFHVDNSTASAPAPAPARKFHVDNSTSNRSAPAIMLDSKLKSISYMQLKTATSKFHARNILGSGEYGSVFKGWINENTLTATASGKGIAVAVKRLHRGSAGRVTKWLQEINYEGRFHHPNLVKTLAYCTEGEQPMVVYEFMPRGSLADHLFQRGFYSKPLSWSLRLNIALGAAKCLEFLHMNKAVHGNIRPSNILLDSHYNSKLSFGVARDSPAYIESYTAPECIRRGYLTATGDVYSFGVVLLEILFWRKVTKSELKLATLRYGEDQLVTVNNRVDQLVPFLDRSYQGGCAMRDARKVIKLALLCIVQEPGSRILMGWAAEVLTAIRFWVESSILPNSRVNLG